MLSPAAVDKEVSFAEDSYLRMTDIEGFCDSLFPLQPPPQEEKFKQEAFEIVIKMLKCPPPETVCMI